MRDGHTNTKQNSQAAPSARRKNRVPGVRKSTRLTRKPPYEYFEYDGRVLPLDALAEQKRWVAWVIEVHNGKPRKVPKDPHTGGNARIPTDPRTWGTLAQARHRYQLIKQNYLARNQTSEGGVGIVLGKIEQGSLIDPYLVYHGIEEERYVLGIDLDGCFKDEYRLAKADWADEVIERFNTYGERSPSGNGVKLFFQATPEVYAALLKLLGHDVTGKQLTRKTFPAGQHREVALDTARFYAVTRHDLGGLNNWLQRIEFEDLQWFVEDLGPRYLAQQKAGNSSSEKDADNVGIRSDANGDAEIKTDNVTLDRIAALEAYAREHTYQLDESGSGAGFRFMMRCHHKGMGYDQARAAILKDDSDAGEWANRVDERQLQRAYDNSKKIADAKEVKSEAKTEANGELPRLATMWAEDLELYPVVPLDWIVPGYVLAGALNGLFGDGATGKDLLLFQLGIAMTCQLRWLDHEVKQGRVLYFHVEDTAEELRRRQNAITTHFNIRCADFPKQFKIVSLFGAQTTLLGAYDPSSGIVKRTALFKQVQREVLEFRPRLTIMHNRVNAFAVNQNDDSQARQCMEMLNSLCADFGTAVIMPSHVSLSGRNTGEGTSGSVQWSNACRLRTYLSRIKDDDGKEDDANARILEVKKANWSATDVSMNLRWSNGLFVAESVQTVPPDTNKPAEQLEHEAEFLRQLDKLDLTKERVSANETANNNAARRFANNSDCKLNGITGKKARQKALHAAMKRLLEKKVITWRRGYRSRNQFRIIRTEPKPGRG